MERRNRFHNTFNSSRYEENLSVFGRKVMHVLVQKWRSEQSRALTCQQPNSSTQTCVLTFRGEEFPQPSEIPTLPLVCHGVSNESNDDGQFPDCNVQQNLRLHNTIPTSSQLVQTFDTSNNATACGSEDTNISSYNLINNVIEGRIPEDNIYEEMFNIKDLPHHGKVIDKKNKAEQVDDFSWDNMFDSELLSTEADLADEQIGLKQTLKLIEANNIPENKTKRNFIKSKENKNKDNIKLKRKRALITDAIPKKVKKVPGEQKITFRKENYTKVVKNWLNNVDINNPVEQIKDVEQNNERAQATIIIEKAKEKSTKKVVQAQLTNKDGVMKFKKPQTVKKLESDKIEQLIPSDKNNFIKQIEKPEKNTIEKVNKDKTPKEIKISKNLNKATKGMPKFVPPIKIQLPVKDVEFPITTMDDNNIDNQNMRSLESIENQELIIVLIYSNGFCQLNRHHTDDTCDPDGFIINVDDHFYYFKGHHQQYKDMLQSLLEKNKNVCYEGKALLKYFISKLDLDIYEINMIDAQIGGSILDPDNPPEDFSELQKLLSFTPQFTIATECVLQKTAWYTTLLKQCGSLLVASLGAEQLWNVFTDIEMKLLPIIAEMETQGVSVDMEKLKSMEDILLAKMKSTELECHKAAGKTFQINSPAQVRALIYDELKLDAKCNLKIRETLAQGAKSTSESMLRGLVSVHALPRLVLEYRHLHKAHSTFLAGIAQHVQDGIVRPIWVQTAAATGRMASSNPNLQAIPKAPFSLVLFPELAGPDDARQEALSFRAVYRARAGCSLLASDFQHVECRVFAHAAADRELLAALRAPGDLFRHLAHKWLQKPLASVSCADRERTKRIVYASLYGAGVRKLMDLLAVDYEQALAVHASFNRTFPSLKSFGASVVSRCAARGGRLVSLGGRARRLAGVASADRAARAHAERQAVNFVIQGSAADLCKLAMVAARAALRRAPLDARLLLQIHDELVWEVRDDQLRAAAVIIKRAMEGCGPAGLAALPVALSVGKNWGAMTAYHAD